jgi:hypothetical protein
MLFAVGLCWVVGLVACVRFPRLSSVLITGGTIVAFTQFFPVLQVLAGALAIATFKRLTGDGLTPGTGPVAGFVITLWTAFPLLLAAFVFGGGHRLIRSASLEGGDDDEPTIGPSD